MWVVLVSLFFGGMLMTQEIKIDAPKTISKEWEAKNLGIKYSCPDLDQAVEELVDGIIDNTFDSALLSRIKTEMEKNPSGEFVEYWPNGQIKARLPYQNKKAHGHLHAWYDNGRDAFKGYFHHGTKQGAHIVFRPSAWDEHPRDARILNYNLEGKLDRTQWIMNKFDRLAFAVDYKKGVVDGGIEALDSKRNKYLDCWYINGEQRNDIPKDQRMPDRSDAAYGKYVHEISYQFMKSVVQEFGLKPSGAGRGMPYDVESISCNFHSHKKMNKDQARNFLFSLKKRLADAINAHEKIRPYLREYPFNPLKADISLFFYDKNFEDYKDGSITYISVDINRNVVFATYDPNDRYGKAREYEPYAEALKIVNGEK